MKKVGREEQSLKHIMGERSALQELFFLHFINHPCVKELLHEQGLLAQHSHGGSVGLDGLETLRRLHFPLQNEAPHLRTVAGRLRGPSDHGSSVSILIS